MNNPGRSAVRSEQPAKRRPLATAKEVAAYLGVPLATIYVWKHRGIGPKVHKVGRHLRYRWAEVDAWLEKQTVDTAA
jgi:excisionase family DNA binding protein